MIFSSCLSIDKMFKEMAKCNKIEHSFVYHKIICCSLHYWSLMSFWFMLTHHFHHYSPQLILHLLLDSNLLTRLLLHSIIYQPTPHFLSTFALILHSVSKYFLSLFACFPSIISSFVAILPSCLITHPTIMISFLLLKLTVPSLQLIEQYFQVIAGWPMTQHCNHVLSKLLKIFHFLSISRLYLNHCWIIEAFLHSVELSSQNLQFFVHNLLSLHPLTLSCFFIVHLFSLQVTCFLSTTAIVLWGLPRIF